MKVASPKAIRKRLKEYSLRPVSVGKGDRGAVIGEFNRVLEDAPGMAETVDQRRYLVWGFCFTPDAEKFKPIKSGDLSMGQIFALKQWIGFIKEDNGDWSNKRGEAFQLEARQILTLAETLEFLDKTGASVQITMEEWLAGFDDAVHEIEKGGMVAAAVNLGGVVTEVQEYEPEEGWVSL